MRRSRHHTQKTADHGRISYTISIRERPAAVEDRAVPGHWDGDLLCGSGNSQIATLVERSTRYLVLVKVDRKDTQTVIDALIRSARKLPNELYKSLTWEHGKEMADHRRFTLRRISRSTSSTRRTLGSAVEREHQRPSAAVLLEGL